MGLGSVTESGATFLSIAGGFIWDRKKDESDPNYAEQTYEKADKTEGVRKGAKYADLTGKVVFVQFKTHQEYGESINVTIEDEDGERYIISVSTNNRNSQDLMKALLKMDLSKDLFLKPYDFIGSDKKRAQGISFRQDGEKLDLKYEGTGMPSQDAEWFKTADKKKIKRFFEDLNDWFVGEVEEIITPQFKPLDSKEKSEKPAPKAATPKVEKEVAAKVEKAAAPKVEKEVAATPAVTPLKMKMKLRAYSTDNYESRELPVLSPTDLVRWYNLAEAEEELPWDESVNDTSEAEDENVEAEVDQDDLDSQLNGLLNS